MHQTIEKLHQFDKCKKVTYQSKLSGILRTFKFSWHTVTFLPIIFEMKSAAHTGCMQYSSFLCLFFLQKINSFSSHSLFSLNKCNKKLQNLSEGQAKGLQRLSEGILTRVESSYNCKGTRPQVIYNPIMAMGFSAMFTSQLQVILRGKHCRRPIAVMGVVDTLGPCF